MLRVSYNRNPRQSSVYTFVRIAFTEGIGSYPSFFVPPTAAYLLRPTFNFDAVRRPSGTKYDIPLETTRQKSRAMHTIAPLCALALRCSHSSPPCRQQGVIARRPNLMTWESFTKEALSTFPWKSVSAERSRLAASPGGTRRRRARASESSILPAAQGPKSKGIFKQGEAAFNSWLCHRISTGAL